MFINVLFFLQNRSNDSLSSSPTTPSTSAPSPSPVSTQTLTTSTTTTTTKSDDDNKSSKTVESMSILKNFPSISFSSITPDKSNSTKKVDTPVTETKSKTDISSKKPDSIHVFDSKKKTDKSNIEPIPDPPSTYTLPTLSPLVPIAEFIEPVNKNSTKDSSSIGVTDNKPSAVFAELTPVSVNSNLDSARSVLNQDYKYLNSDKLHELPKKFDSMQSEIFHLEKRLRYLKGLAGTDVKSKENTRKSIEEEVRKVQKETKRKLKYIGKKVCFFFNFTFKSL